MPKKKCKDCKTVLMIVGEYPPLEWCGKCNDYKNLKETRTIMKKEFKTIEEK